MAGPKDYLNRTPKQIMESIELGNLNGMFHTIPEPYPEINENSEIAENQKVYERYPTYQYAEIERSSGLSTGCRNGNSYIILGKDRNGDLSTGFGGTKNYPASHAIDLVVGLASSHKDKSKSLSQSTEVGKNFYTDAARVYISQRTDLNTYFGINEGYKKSSDGLVGCSGVGIKADMVLVNGRRNVKIRAGGAHGDNLPNGGEKLAHGQEAPTDAAKIELLIANMEPEPAVLGNKLVNKLRQMEEQTEQLKSEVVELNTELALLRMQLALHIHGDPISVLTLPSPDLAIAAAVKAPKVINNIVVGVYNKLRGKLIQLGTDTIPNNEEYILSKNVFIS